MEPSKANTRPIVATVNVLYRRAHHMTTTTNGQWSNWSGSVQSMPRQIVKPVSIEELAHLMKMYGRDERHVRVVGAGHSFTPLVQTDDILMSLENLQGVTEVNTEQNTVTVRGGTWLKRLGDDLFKRGLAQENLVDINVQSIAGAISTGTHGTGIASGSLATQVEGFTLITADGERLECSTERNPDIFKAAQVSLGTLGVVAEVKLRVVPAKRLHFKSKRESLAQCLTHLDEYKHNNDHFEFYWVPHTGWALTKANNRTGRPAGGHAPRAGAGARGQGRRRDDHRGRPGVRARRRRRAPRRRRRKLRRAMGASRCRPFRWGWLHSRVCFAVSARSRRHRRR